MAQIGTDIAYATELLKKGEIVAIPTETVYGLAADGRSRMAIKKIYKAKNRPLTNPLILHFGSMESIVPYVSDLPEKLKKLAKQFWPGPLTLLLPKSERVISVVNAGLPHVAVRIPDHPLTLDLIQRIGFPLAAPSANPFGYISPTSARQVHDQLGDQLGYILDGGNCKKGLESTIVGIRDNQLIIYRLGAITAEAISLYSGELIQIESKATQAPTSPGQLPYH